MSYRRHGLKALGLCLLAALSLLAVTAAGAQAKGKWIVEGTPIAATTGVNGEIDKDGEVKDTTLLSTIGVTNTEIEILCSELKIKDGLLFAGSEEGKALAELEFSKCETFLKKVKSAVCAPTVDLVKLKALLIKHESKSFVLFSPDTGTKFTVVLFPEECSLPPEVAVTGNLVAECVNATNDCNVEAVKQLIRQAPAALFTKDKLVFGERAASLDGGALLFLTAEGKKWKGEGATVEGL